MYQNTKTSSTEEGNNNTEDKKERCFSKNLLIVLTITQGFSNCARYSNGRTQVTQEEITF